MSHTRPLSRPYMCGGLSDREQRAVRGRVDEPSPLPPGRGLPVAGQLQRRRGPRPGGFLAAPPHGPRSDRGRPRLARRGREPAVPRSAPVIACQARGLHRPVVPRAPALRGGRRDRPRRRGHDGRERALCAAGRPRAYVTRRARRLCRSEEHTSELQSRSDLVCRLLLEKKKKKNNLLLLVKKKKNTKKTTI